MERLGPIQHSITPVQPRHTHKHNENNAQKKYQIPCILYSRTMSKTDENTQPMLTNEKAWELIRLPKKFENDVYNNGICAIKNERYTLVSDRYSDPFTLDINKSSIGLKYTFQTRIHMTIRLLRFDFGGSHTNPKQNCTIDENDPFYLIHTQCIGKIFKSEPHIHVYREGFEDKWAYPAKDVIENPSDMSKSLINFLNYCGVSEIPPIKGD